MGCLGQQIIDSKRVQKKVRKIFAILFQNDDTPEARGFVSSSYVDGLKAQEQFFHTMGGREGLIDTTIKTAVTGYISRKLMVWKIFILNMTELLEIQPIQLFNIVRYSGINQYNQKLNYYY